MRKPSVLVIEPESSGLDLLRAAGALGFTAHFFDRRPLDEMPQAVREAVAAGQVVYGQVETRSRSAVLTAARKLASEVELVAVVPGFEYSVATVAATARALGLRGVDPESAEVLLDKGRMKERLAAAGVAVTPGVQVTAGRADERALQDVAERIGFPAVVKPVDGAGSLGVRRVDDLAALREQVNRGEGPMDDMGKPVGERLLVEAYVTGAEYSVEGFTTPAGVVVVAITEKQLGPEPCFVEIGHVVEADLPTADRTALTSVAVAAVRALKLDHGVFHLEARLSPAGPVVLEVAARLAGDRIPRLVALTHGCDLPQILVRCLAGLPVEPSGTERVAGAVSAARILAVTEPSTLADPEQLEKSLRALPGCPEATVTCPPGALLLPPTDFRQRFGHLVLTAPDRARLDELLDEADLLVRSALEGADPCAC